MALRVAINGFGRIGRPAFKIASARKDIELVAINDLTDTKTLAYLLQFDSVYGTFEKQVEATADGLRVDGKEIKVFAEKDPAQLPWKELGVDVVIESSGFFTDGAGASKHLQAGAKAVVLSANCKAESDMRTFVYKVNTDGFDPARDQMTSMGSCTTNCLAPLAKVLNDKFGIVKGMMTTVHSYTNSQRLVDTPAKELREARSAVLSMIPTTTGAAKAISRVIPALKGKVDGHAVRVPTPTVSITDFVCEVERATTAEEVNAALREAAAGELAGVLACESRELVSADFRKNPHGSIVDESLTLVVSGNLVKVLSWYDNEWGYCTRLIDYVQFVGDKMKN